MKINVTEGDIVFGQTFHPCYCPIALAVQRQIPEATFVAVDPNIVQVIVFGYICTFDADRQTNKFIRNFDSGNYVESGEYCAQPRRVSKL